MIHSLVKISPELDTETIVYRTIDFFSAASMHLKKNLMFSRADTFSDKNEGVDRLLAQLELSFPDGGCGKMGWTDSDTARSEHEAVKRSYYISCWSRTKESVAMWSLYSPDFCSVRISTRISNLIRPLDALTNKYSVSRLNTTDLKKNVVIASQALIEPVTYSSLSEISRKISKRFRARARLHERYQRKGLETPKVYDTNLRHWDREQQRRIQELKTAFNLKDISFQHEGEIRLSVRVGETICSKAELDIRDIFINPKNADHDLFKMDFINWPWIRSGATPEREFAECGISLIESVAIDPRCPPHKAAFMKNWFDDHNVPIVDSDCFGYLPDTFTAYPIR